MAGVITDVGAMQAAAGHVRTVNDSLAGTIRSLGDRCQGAAGSWEGGAAVQFQSLMQRYNDASAKMQQSLSVIADKIEQNGKGYDATEQSHQDAINSAGQSGSLDLPPIISA